MSNVGQAALIVVGTVVGAYFGYPQLGFVLGSLAGSALFPTQLPPGPRISDNRTTTSTVGNPIAIVKGTANVAGTVIWLAPYVEHSQNQGGKGGPEQRTYSYTQSIAIGLCERIDDSAPDEEPAIAGISRIWENGAIVYDIRPQQRASSDLNSLAETDAAYASRLAASAVYAETFTLYLGDELQLADPTIQAVQGVQNTPAFRGLAYIVYPNRALQIAQGLRHPNFQFEVFESGLGECTSSNETSTSLLFPWGSGTGDPTNSRNLNTFNIVIFDDRLVNPSTGLLYYTHEESTGIRWGQNFTSMGDAQACLATMYQASMRLIGYQAAFASDNPTGTLTQQTGAGETSGSQSVSLDPEYVYTQHWFCQPIEPNEWFTDAERGTHAYAYLINDVYWEEIGTSQAQIWWASGPPSYEGDPARPYPPWISPYFTGSDLIGVYPWDSHSLIWTQSSYSACIKVLRAPNAPPDPCLGLTPSVIPGFSVQLDGSLIKCGAWTLTTGSSVYKSLQTYNRGGAHAGGSTVLYYPLNPCLAPTDPNYNNATFWTDAYDAAVAAGWMPAGLSYQTSAGPGYPAFQNFIYSNTIEVCTGAGNGVSVAEIIASICKRAGLLQIDVSDLETTFVDGYAIASVCTGSSIITPLRSIAFFDAVETNGEIKFAARGKPIVATLTTDDFGAYDATNTTTDASGASTCPPSVTTTRSQDEDLPRSIRFHYIATMRDYEDAEQDSPFRLATAATNDVDITIPVCLSDTLAAKCASVLWADAWASRTAYEISVDQAWLHLDVGDCIAVPVDGFTQRMRIVSDTMSSGVLRKLSLVRDDEGAYISYAVASLPQRVPQVLNFLLPTAYELLDLPCLQDADSDPGFYVAAQRASDTAGTWTGCVIYKSNDSGATFNSQLSLITEATIGTLGLGVLASQPYTWDDVTVITVNVDSEFSFESVSDDAMLAGQNTAAMGADGRWEIVQFGIATKVSDTQWQLSHLLRGRRGTEHVMGSSKSTDSFVMVSTGDLGRVVLQTTEIGASRVYKGVTIGADYSTGVDETFTGHAQALVPFSPVNPAAVRLTDGDILISWTRRSRLGRTLMDGVDIPLGETTEAFSIDILTGSPTMTLRTLASSTTSVLYTHAQQESDFGSPLPSSINVAIYQLSSIVGRGTPVIETLTVTEV